MSRWWRAYDEAVDDPKLCLLNDKQHRAWFNLCCITSQNGGTLPPIAAVAFKLRMPVTKAKHLVAELVTLGLIDHDETVFAPHNWNVRQFKSDVSNERVKRFRERKCNVTETVTVTPPETETETKQKRKKEAAIAASDPEADLYRRGKEVLGETAGGLIRQLVTAKDGKFNLARAAIETAAGKENPREYIGGVLRNQKPQPGEVSHHVDGRL